MRTLRLVVACLFALPVVAQAAPITYSGYLDDAGSLSPAGQLVNYVDLGAPDLTVFPDQNVALFEFTVAAASAYTVTSRGYNDVYGNVPNVDGIDTYVALFQDTGIGASYLAEFSNPVQAGDFQATSGVLAAGTYTLAISMWNNYACGSGACLPSTGTLGDGFSGLSQFDPSRELYFEVDLEAVDGTDPTPVPEPATLLMVCAGMAGLARTRMRSRGYS